MNNQNFSNALLAQDRQEKALAEAKAILLAKGIVYPMYDTSKSPDANYEAMCLYAQEESALVVRLLKEPSGPRPLVIDNVTPRKQGWDGYSD